MLTPLAMPWPTVPEGVYDPADLGYGKARFIHPGRPKAQPIKRLPKPMTKPDADA